MTQDTPKKMEDYPDYDKVIRDMISKEIDRQHNYMNWQVMVHAILFAAIVRFDIIEKYKCLLILLCILGIVISLLYFFTYLASEEKIKRIFYFWDGYLKYTNTSYFMFPPVWGNPDNYEEDRELEKNSNVFKAFHTYPNNCFRRFCLKVISPKSSWFPFLVVWTVILIKALS